VTFFLVGGLGVAVFIKDLIDGTPPPVHPWSYRGH